MKTMLLQMVSSSDEIYGAVSHTPAWAYWMIGVGVFAIMASAAYLISKKIK